MRAQPDELPMILLDGVGRVRRSGDSILTPVPFTEVERTLGGLAGDARRLARCA